MEYKIKHLEMLQNTITRMSGNSFLLKGWTVTLMTGIFVLSDKDSNRLFFLGAYIPLFVFWGMDAFYLHQERLFRKLYDYVRVQKPQQVDFSMNPAAVRSNSKKNRYLDCLFSITELGFYLPLLLLYSVLAVFSLNG